MGLQANISPPNRYSNKLKNQKSQNRFRIHFQKTLLTEYQNKLE